MTVAGERTQGLALAREVLYCLSPTLSLLVLFCFGDGASFLNEVLKEAREVRDDDPEGKGGSNMATLASAGCQRDLWIDSSELLGRPRQLLHVWGWCKAWNREEGDTI
jgi:hypothetical protein